MKLYPITFSIPETKVQKDVRKLTKIKMISSLIPGKLDTYIYNNEKDYYEEYQKSFFAITTKKGGWDCLRHYEIIANGCIPYFPNIENCPTNTLSLFPKTLIIEGNQLYEKYKNKNVNELTLENIQEYNNLNELLINYLKNNLTTIKIAQYILNNINTKNVENILYLSGDTSPDYLRCLTLHGFKTLLKKNCHDYPKVPHIYKKDENDYNLLYGKGITYTNLLENELHDNILEENVKENIINKKYDIIIYGSYHRGMPFLELIYQYYEPDKIILLCGEEYPHICDYNIWINKGHYVFVRELDH